MTPTDTTVTLFDLDGTLTDSAPGILAGFRHALATVGVAAPEGDLLDRVVGPPMIDTLRSLGLDEAAAQAALTAYFDRYDHIGWAENAVFDGIEELLTSLAESGTRLAIATSKSERFANRILEHFSLARHFEVIAGASDEGTGRRAKADVIEHALRGLGVEPTTAADGGTAGVVMVGDREHDVHGAAHWGIPTVFVGWGYGTDREAADAHWSVDSVDELGRVLDERRVRDEH
ncbi:HAD family hydrolase [Rhodococcus spelaei]|uniref:HAD family hydrolase n=1 Tax=Rhodococcus spelaei TaxID=2546320 RepID=A0A541BMG4_9NOCA|nr:HAD hydrolase-like protein [Rhodococcus spelaei]TQF73516.1 HAD family hydrolase [Rhodococcus spelaei]